MVSTREITAKQGTQPTFAGIRVGVMRVGLKDGQAAVQLALRSVNHSEIVVANTGDSISLLGGGELHILDIAVGDGASRGSVTLTLDDSSAATRLGGAEVRRDG